VERIRGPVNGYYVVSYACEIGDLGREYVGYTRLCASRPESFWDAQGPITYGNARFATAAAAMDNSEAIALRELA
jgi:hypothetical protein